MCTQGNNEIIKTLKKELEEVKLRLGELEEYTHGTEIAKVDSEEVEFTKQELSTIYYAMKEVGENFPSGNENEKYLNTIISKLNKMLKEKGNEEE